MKIGAILLAVMLIGGWAWAGDGGTNQALRLELDLLDGSHIIGAPAIASVPVQTPYAKIAIGKDAADMTIDLCKGGISGCSDDIHGRSANHFADGVFLFGWPSNPEPPYRLPGDGLRCGRFPKMLRILRMSNLAVRS